MQFVRELLDINGLRLRPEITASFFWLQNDKLTTEALKALTIEWTSRIFLPLISRVQIVAQFKALFRERPENQNFVAQSRPNVLKYLSFLFFLVFCFLPSYFLNSPLFSGHSLLHNPSVDLEIKNVRTILMLTNGSKYVSSFIWISKHLHILRQSVATCLLQWNWSLQHADLCWEAKVIFQTNGVDRNFFTARNEWRYAFDSRGPNKNLVRGLSKPKIEQWKYSWSRESIENSTTCLDVWEAFDPAVRIRIALENVRKYSLCGFYPRIDKEEASEWPHLRGEKKQEWNAIFNREKSEKIFFHSAFCFNQVKLKSNFNKVKSVKKKLRCLVNRERYSGLRTSCKF